MPKPFLERLRSLLFDRRSFFTVVTVLLLWEAFLNVAIVMKVKYTEIDWIAYMQEVEGPLVKGEWDYLNLRGDTGPLVYPAGFVYLYALLYYATNGGVEIFRAQLVFVGLYLATLFVVAILYIKSRVISPWVLGLLCLSYRLHSLYALRLFNDCFASFFLYASLWLFVSRRWSLGCFVFSVAVSIKMNVLLFAPPLLLLLLKTHGVVGTIPKLAICASWQVISAVPFLVTNWRGYVGRAFELGRVFTYKWTVNFRFLPEDVFVSKNLAMGLLVGHLAFLGFFARKWCKEDGGIKAVLTGKRVGPVTAEHILTTMFTGNLVGIAFARSLHYQFYTWYFHSLPFLLWRATVLPVPIKLCVLLAVEVAFNTYPSTPTSSAVLHVAHAVLVLALALSPLAPARVKSD